MRCVFERAKGVFVEYRPSGRQRVRAFAEQEIVARDEFGDEVAGALGAAGCIIDSARRCDEETFVSKCERRNCGSWARGRIPRMRMWRESGARAQIHSKPAHEGLLASRIKWGSHSKFRSSHAVRVSVRW
jgi:hypothetical protein